MHGHPPHFFCCLVCPVCGLCALPLRSIPPLVALLLPHGTALMRLRSAQRFRPVCGSGLLAHHLACPPLSVCISTFLQFVVHGSMGWKGPEGIQAWTTSQKGLIVHAHLPWNGLQAVLPWTMNCKNLPQRLLPFACCRDAEIQAVFSASRSVSLRNPAFCFRDAEIRADISASRPKPGRPGTKPFILLPNSRSTAAPGTESPFLLPTSAYSFSISRSFSPF